MRGRRAYLAASIAALYEMCAAAAAHCAAVFLLLARSTAYRMPVSVFLSSTPLNVRDGKDAFTGYAIVRRFARLTCCTRYADSRYVSARRIGG